MIKKSRNEPNYMRHNMPAMLGMSGKAQHANRVATSRGRVVHIPG